MTDQPAECAPVCAEQHTYQLSTCALACTERFGGVADQAWTVPCPRCKATADRPCTRWDGSAASVACQERWDLHDQRAAETRRAQASMVADAFPVPLHLIDTSQPVEHCGHQLPPLIGDGPVTECVLRPGHQGSHANETGTRWIEKTATGYCPHCGRGDCAPTADEYEASQRRAVRIQTLLDEQRDKARKDAAASRESERQLQQQIDAQAKEIDRLRDAHRFEEELSADLRARLKATSDACSDATTALAEVLAEFRFDTHPGERCKQTGHVEVARVERWRAVLYPPKETPDA